MAVKDCRRLLARRATRRQLIAGLGAWLGASALAACRPAVAVPTPLPALPSPPPELPATATPPRPTPVPPTAVPATQMSVPTSAPTSAPTVVPTTVPSPTTAPSPTAVSLIGNTDNLRPDGPPHDPGPLDWAHPGPYLGSGFDASSLATFSSQKPLVTTYYFYWDDMTDPTRRDPDRKFHQPDLDHYSFLNPDTHRRQFADMEAAGIDFALAVYWGEPGHPGRSFNTTPGHDWSTEGIPPLVQALDQLATAGRSFKIGMFYDTTILANADLTTPNGLAYFYVNVRDFFSRIPPRHWAAIDNKPVVWLYDTQWVSRFNQATFADLSDRFAADFGGLRPYIVREWQWLQSKGVQPTETIKSDTFYGWGAAASGFNPDPRFGVAEVGPGFDNTYDCGGTVTGGCMRVDRANGDYYAGQLAAALRSGRKIIAIETWNEFDESTGIAETVEFGRAYINLTRKYADAFHAGRRTIG